MLSIWPSFSAAPRMRHSALASRSALSSVSHELVGWALQVGVEGGRV